MNAPLLTVARVRKTFGGVTALADVSLDVFEGEIRAVIGPNGSGKSTLINVLSGVSRPDSGTIMFRGEPITRTRPYLIARRGIGRTFQNLRLFRELTVLENVLAGVNSRGVDSFWDIIARTSAYEEEESRARSDATEACARVGITHLVDAIAGSLSYGQQRRVEIARALVAAPKLLLLDEPVAGMNAAEVRSLGDQLCDLRNQGLTILLIEHNMRFVMSLADRISVFDYGEKIFEGPPNAVRAEPCVINAYLGVN